MVLILTTFLFQHLRLAMDTYALAHGDQFVDLALVAGPMRIEHAGDTRHHEHIRTRLENSILVRCGRQIRRLGILVIAVSVATIEGVVIINKGHRVARETMLAQTLERLVGIQFAIRTAYDAAHRVLSLEIEHHRVVFRLLQVPLLAVDAVP